MIKKIKKFINLNNLDGYIVPKNDNYFTEYSNVNNLEKISNFTGSRFALILKDINYLFVDGRYIARKTIWKKFYYIGNTKYLAERLKKIKIKDSFDPKLFTELTLKKYFDNYARLVPIKYNFKNNIKKSINSIFKKT